jgi:hypothetical protein
MSRNVYLAMAITTLTCIAPLRAQGTLGSPLFAGGRLQQGETLQSGDGCVELRFFYADGYYNRLDLRGIGGAGCGGSNWDSYSDFDWQGIGRGLHESNNEPRGMRAAEAVMQADGNFVLYDLETGIPLWATHTDGHPGAYLNVQGDGNMVIYSASNDVLWSLF